MLVLKIKRDTFFKQTTEFSERLNSEQKVYLTKGTQLKIKSYYKKDKHYFVHLNEALGSVGKAGFLFEEDIDLEEIRGVWITNVDSEMLHSKSNIEKHLKTLKKLKFNTLYPVVWNKGFAFFKSNLVDNTHDSNEEKLRSVNLEKELVGRDILAEIIEVNQSLDNHFRIIPWFEYGLMVHPNASLVTKKPHWFMLTHKQENTVDGNYRLNPAHPEVKDFMVSFVTEAVKNYEIDGIQLDDHFSIYHTKFLPDNKKTFDFSMGFDPFTVNLFEEETGSVSPLTNPNLKAFKDWRKNKLTELIELIFKAIKSERNDCILSMSPNPLSFSIDHALADWQTWEQEGLIEELAIQVYRHNDTFDNNMKSFERELNKSEVKAAKKHIPTVIGIITGLRKKGVTLDLIQAQTQVTRDKDFAGFAYFFYGSLFEYIPSTETVDKREETFATILSTDQFV